MNWLQIKLKAAEAVCDYSIEHKKRLLYEFQEIERQGNNSYWERLVDDKASFDLNKNGLVLPFLLGITSIDPVEKGISHNIEYKPDFPDIDVDFVGDARPLIKQYVSEKYGDEHVCSVGLWQRYAMRLALQDVARALGADVEEIIQITKTLPEEIDELPLEHILKDDEFSGLIEYYNKDDEHKRIVETAFRMKKLIKAHGTHAGGFIISSVPVVDYIPLNRRSDDWITEWTEGQSTQLSKFGFIKFDFLGLKTLKYIWATKKLLLEKHGIKIDWSAMNIEKDRAGAVCYPNGNKEYISFSDEKCLRLIEEDKVETIFQFDTPLARRILRNKVTNFNDILVFTALGRPGPLPYMETYVKRRDGAEDLPEEIHSDITEILEETLQVIVYQEQLTEIWRRVGGFSVPEAEAARKAVAKKWADKLKFVKQKWLDGASPVLGQSAAEDMYTRMETFGRYAFNKCLDEDTILYDPVADEYFTIGNADFEMAKGKEFHLYSYNNGEIIIDKVKDISFTGKQLVFRIEFANGGHIDATLDHKFMSAETEEMIKVSDLIYDDIPVLTYNNNKVKIRDVRRIGHRNTYNIEMESSTHNYFVPLVGADCMILSANSHAHAYSLIIYRTLFLKSHFPYEWWSSVLTHCNIPRRPDYISAMRNEGIDLLMLNIDDISMNFAPSENGVQLGLRGIKGIGDSLINKLMNVYNPPYESFDQFVKDISYKVLIERLIKLGAFDKIEPNRKLLWVWYNYKYSNTAFAKEIKTKIRSVFGWPKSEIEKERKRLINKFIDKNPHKKRIPNNVKNWKPTTPYLKKKPPIDDLDEHYKLNNRVQVPYDLIKKFISEDFSQFERLGFQKSYLGYYLDSSMSVYESSGYDVNRAKKEGILECIIENYTIRPTRNGGKFCILSVTDGIHKARVNVWESDIKPNRHLIKKSQAVVLFVSWDDKYGSFSLLRNSKVKPLSGV